MSETPKDDSAEVNEPLENLLDPLRAIGLPSQYSLPSGEASLPGAVFPTFGHVRRVNPRLKLPSDVPDEGNNQDIINAAGEYQKQCGERIAVHSQKAERYAKQHYWIGIPLVIATSLAGISSVGSIAQANQVPFLNWTIIASSLLAAILAPMQTFLNLADRGVKHQEAASGYENLKNRIEVFFLRYPTANKVVREDAVAMMEKFTTDLTQLRLKSPPI